MNSAQTEKEMKKKLRYKRLQFSTLMIVMIVCLSLSVFLFIIFGALNVEFPTIIESMTNYDRSNFHHIVIREVRIPRALAGIVVGCSLAICGAIMQGSTRNPMADTGLMGIVSGAMLCMAIVIVFFPFANRFNVMLLACVGSGAATFTVYFIASMGKRGMTPERLVLAGMSISMLLGSITSGLLIKYEKTRDLAVWMAGSTANVTWFELQISMPIFLVGTATAVILGRSITVMSLGDDVAIGLGLKVKTTKVIITFIILFLTGMSVIIIGPVGYIGLVTPHIIRYFVGVDYRYIIPASGLFGALLVVSVDLLGRIMMSPYEMPIGILLSMIGVPFFIYISRRQKREFQ